jgi:hypothetical protein
MCKLELEDKATHHCFTKQIEFSVSCMIAWLFSRAEILRVVVHLNH